MTPKPDPRPGDVVAGHELIEIAGVGSMGIVFRARAPDGRIVAMKILKAEKAGNPESLRDFRNEAEATGMVDHENVVTILDHGQADGYHYIRMEFVDGPPLDRLLLQEKRLPWRRATEIVICIARALERAHEKGLVHRDVKPQNVLLYRDGRVRLTDFGIVKDISSLRGFLVKGRKLGTAAYASPEQCLDKRLDAATDMYSLGATFYHLACGRYVFTGDSPRKIMAKHVKAKPIPPSRIVPEMPKALSNVIEKMLEKKQTDRYGDMSRLVTDLTLILDGKVAIPDRSPRVDPRSVKRLRRTRHPAEEARRKPKVPAEMWIVIGLLAVAAFLVVLVLLD